MHFSLRRRSRLRIARVAVVTTVVGITVATVSTSSVGQHHTSPVALHDSGLRVGRGVAAMPSTGVVHFTQSATAKPQTPRATPKPTPTPPPPPPPAPAPPPPPPGPPAREVMGFAPSWTLDTWPEWHMRDLSAIAYFAVTIDGNGNTVTDDAWPTWQSQQLTDMVNAAHANHVKVLVTVKNFVTDEINSIVTSGQHMATAVQTATDLMRMRGLDGVVVDFEGASSPQYPFLQQGIVQFSAALQASVHAYRADAEYVLATYSGSASWDDGIFNIGKLGPTVDAFFVMAYDMNSDNNPGHAGATSPLSGGQFNDTDAISQYLAKTTADKVILGVPYYGYKWSVSSYDANAATTGPAEAETYSQLIRDLTCGQVDLAVHQQDPTPWAVWNSVPSGDPCGANLGSWREVYFDTALSLGAKYDLVNRSNLRGTGMWALGFDAGHNDLWDALHSHLSARH
ncbi:MAG TPA: glycosyl hydrolase family 18 protein [Candidatus Dormibacteraeota bacterium]|nr:glycosyl hydrolase family 18 protein [Candidatus Dormibacteraeota bacterium]